MSRILVIGVGSIGKRYMAIIKYLGHEAIGVDINRGPYSLESFDFDKAIVCTPTDSHFEPAYALAYMDKPFLIEKPVSKQILEIKKIKEKTDKAYMVNNWAHVFTDIKLLPYNNSVYYDHYNTGSDGLAWDCIQLIYLANEIMLDNVSPFFHCTINEDKVTLDMVTRSYVNMLLAFVDGDYHALWTLEQAIDANKKVEGYIEEVRQFSKEH